ncbi:General stress protein A [Stieleria maiorica]|uniref:General stress protein A n=1 Tax=Stieleria maiorica TaxID=2795974 RepID=A0A5B9MLF9_9BACT|nr:glycosyltransferase family 8 protein [Stieleria maiorica]QEG02212.1 General stress protein A [Stieleria maiorica]
MKNQEPIALVSGSDDAYTLPLAVTIASAIKSLSADRRLDVYILDGGISDASKRRLLASWEDPRVSVQWIPVSRESFERFPVSHHINAATYMRLAIAEYLPASVQRAIYLDADMLVRQDLGLLWDEPQGDAALLAVQDYAAPFIDASTCLTNFEQAQPYLAAVHPIANFRELGLPADAPYFNGGMLVIDVKAWRERNLAKHLFECLEEHREHVLWWDQYALNVVLAGSWRSLDLRWNQGAHLYVYPSGEHSPFDSSTHRAIVEDPWIVHFCSPDKPWNYFCRHPYTDAFRKQVRQTDWHGWKPERPDEFMRRWWGHHYKPARERWKTQVRRIKENFRSRNRAA